jgi:hypothetical protein
MWDTTNLNLFPTSGRKHVERRGIPHLAKNERDMGHPTLCGRDKVKRKTKIDTVGTLIYGHGEFSLVSYFPIPALRLTKQAPPACC